MNGGLLFEMCKKRQSKLALPFLYSMVRTMVLKSHESRFISELSSQNYQTKLHSLANFVGCVVNFLNVL